MANRDDYHRCKVCKRLALDSPEHYDPVQGFRCPHGCKEYYTQPEYESPLQDEATQHSKEVPEL
jgi:hypothetical protein